MHHLSYRGMMGSDARALLPSWPHNAVYSWVSSTADMKGYMHLFRRNIASLGAGRLVAKAERPQRFDFTSNQQHRCQQNHWHTANPLRVIWSHLRNGLPVGGVVLAGVDAVVPAPLHHVEDGLHRDVELGGPADLQLARLMLQKHQLLPGLQRDSWERTQGRRHAVNITRRVEPCRGASKRRHSYFFLPPGGKWNDTIWVGQMQRFKKWDMTSPQYI